jgi:hypothetical protein
VSYHQIRPFYHKLLQLHPKSSSNLMPSKNSSLLMKFNMKFIFFPNYFSRTIFLLLLKSIRENVLLKVDIKSLFLSSKIDYFTFYIKKGLYFEINRQKAFNNSLPIVWIIKAPIIAPESKMLSKTEWRASPL